MKSKKRAKKARFDEKKISHKGPSAAEPQPKKRRIAAKNAKGAKRKSRKISHKGAKVGEEVVNLFVDGYFFSELGVFAPLREAYPNPKEFAQAAQIFKYSNAKNAKGM